MLEAEPEAVLDVMAKAPIGKRCKKVPHTYIDQMADRMKYLTCRHDIRFSTHPSVVMLSYIFLAQIEIQDIINIINGALRTGIGAAYLNAETYHLAPEEIQKLLTVADFSRKEA